MANQKAIKTDKRPKPTQKKQVSRTQKPKTDQASVPFCRPAVCRSPCSLSGFQGRFLTTLTKKSRPLEGSLARSSYLF